MNKPPRSHNTYRQKLRRAGATLAGTLTLAACGVNEAPVDTRDNSRATAEAYPTVTETVTEVPEPTPDRTTVSPDNTATSEATHSPEPGSPDGLRRTAAAFIAQCNLDGLTSYAQHKNGQEMRIATLDVSFVTNPESKAVRDSSGHTAPGLRFGDTQLVVANLDQATDKGWKLTDKTAGVHYPRNARVEVPNNPEIGTTYIVMAGDWAADDEVTTKVLTPCGSFSYNGGNRWEYGGNNELPAQVEPQYIDDDLGAGK